MRRLPQDQRGSMLLIFIITLPFLILLATYYMQLSLTSFQVARLDEFSTKAQLAADAGADYAIQQIAQDNAWTGTAGEQTLHNAPDTRTTYSVTVTDTSATTKRLNITGRTYWPATTEARKVNIRVDLRAVTSGNFSVVSGAGGLTMRNSAKIVGGSVLINGEINLENSAQIGLSTTPLNVNVAHQSCPTPPDATWPRICNSGEAGQPITISNNARIYGTVRANNQTNGTNMLNPGLVAGSVTPQALPTHDRAAQKAAATNVMTAAAASCSGNQSITWPANTRITGDVTVAGSCRVTVQGNVWIQGALTMTQSGQLIVADSLGTTTPTIMVDGQAGATFRNSSALVSNGSQTGFKVITFYSTASCSPDCTSLTGTEAFNSRSITTITLNNSGASPDTLFYSYWTRLDIQQSGSIGAIVGQTLNIANTGTVTFGGNTGVGNVIWVTNGYRKL